MKTDIFVCENTEIGSQQVAPQPARIALREPEAAALLGVAPLTLQRARLRGDSVPPYRLVGTRVIYSISALNDWLDGKTTAPESLPRGRGRPRKSTLRGA